MIAALNMLQPTVSNDVNTSHAEAKDVRQEQTTKTSFKRVYAKLAGNADKPGSQSVSDKSRVESDTGSTSGLDEENTATTKTDVVKLLRELKHALKEKSERETGTNGESDAANPIIPESLMGMLQKLEQTVTNVVAEKSEAGDKQLLLLTKELKSVLTKIQEACSADKTGVQQTVPVAAGVISITAMPEQKGVPENQQCAPVTAGVRRSMALLEQIEKMLADDSAQKTAQIDASVKSSAVPVSTDMKSDSITWMEYMLQRQQEQKAGQATTAGQNAGSSGTNAQEPETRTVITQLMTASTRAQNASESVQQQQASTASEKPSESAIDGVSQSAGVKKVNAESSSIRSANPVVGRNGENPANMPKTDNSQKSAENSELSKVEIIMHEAATKEKSGFTDGGAQQNAGEKGGNSSTNSTLATSLRGFEQAVQNTTQPQVQPQNENVKTPVQEHIMNQVKEKLAHYEPTSQGGNITMKLHPDELGELKINLRMDAMRVKVEIVAQNQVVKDTIMQNVDNLRDMLSSRNITIDRFDVSTGGGQGSNQAFREGRQMAGDMPYKSYDDMPAMMEDAVGQINSYWEPTEKSLVNLRL
jgi:flagellar hook-length control protein FliK